MPSIFRWFRRRIQRKLPDSNTRRVPLKGYFVIQKLISSVVVVFRPLRRILSAPHVLGVGAFIIVLIGAHAIVFVVNICSWYFRQDYLPGVSLLKALLTIRRVISARLFDLITPSRKPLPRKEGWALGTQSVGWVSSIKGSIVIVSLMPPWDNEISLSREVFLYKEETGTWISCGVQPRFGQRVLSRALNNVPLLGPFLRFLSRIRAQSLIRLNALEATDGVESGAEVRAFRRENS